MAVDTRDKRSSAIHASSPWRHQLPTPDGTVGQGDRQETAGLYSGIAAASPGGVSIMAYERRTWRRIFSGVWQGVN